MLCATGQDGAIHRLGGMLGHPLLWICGSCTAGEVGDDSGGSAAKGPYFVTHVLFGWG